MSVQLVLSRSLKRGPTYAVQNNLISNMQTDFKKTRNNENIQEIDRYSKGSPQKHLGIFKLLIFNYTVNIWIPFLLKKI